MRISPFQLTDNVQWSGLTTENHLGYLGMQNRELISPIVDSIMEQNLGLDFDRFMDNFPTHTIDRDVEFEWLLAGPDIKNYPLISYYDSSGAVPAKPGINHTRFFMEFPVRMFEPTDAIATDSKEIYQLKVIEVQPIGTNWKFEVELITGDPALFVPATELVAGKRFAKLYSPVEQTLSQRGGTVQHNSYFKMHNRCSSIRMNVDVPGNLIDAGDDSPLQTAFMVKDENNKPKQMKTWLGKLDWDFRSQFKRQKAYLGMYAIFNKTVQGTYVNKGESGYDMKMGAGLYQQISPSNVHYLNNYTLDQLQDILFSLSIGKLPQDERKFVIATGERGWVRFHKLVEARALPFSANNAGNRVTGTGNNLRFGGQFTSVGFLNGIEVTLMQLPFLDDPTFNTAQHPDGGLVSSYEMLIMDIGKSNGKPNIERVVVKNNETDIYGYVPGLRDPFVPNGTEGRPKQSATLKDGYQMGCMHIRGIKVNNPTRIARILPNFV
jgi:hypothetical protein